MSSAAQSDEPNLLYAALVNALIQGWGGLTVAPAKGAHDANETKGVPKPPKEPLPQRAYLVFNRFEDNPLAQSLEDQFPKWARDRVSVPDSYFEHRAERAPFLLELPQELLSVTPGFKRQGVLAWLAHCLEVAQTQASKRLTAQDFCGVVISPANEQAISQHWVGLGEQQPLGSEDSVLFRYQDPRVMQRVWPALSPSQQSRWLGPVTRWWSLLQPWGPISNNIADQSEEARWVQVKAPLLPYGEQTGGSPRHLFDEEQWRLSGISPQANLIWRGYADNGVAPQAQPDADSMHQMLADGQRLGLEDLNIEDYVWSTWLHAPNEGPPRAMDWRQPHLAPTLSWIEARLRDQPNARFSTLLNQAVQPQR